MEKTKEQKLASMQRYLAQEAKAIEMLQEEEQKIEDWLKEEGYTTDGCIDAGFEPIEGHQGRVMSFEYNGNIEEFDVDALAASIVVENVIDDRFSVRVFVYDDEDGEEYKNMFCVEIWLNE